MVEQSMSLLGEYGAIGGVAFVIIKWLVMPLMQNITAQNQRMMAIMEQAVQQNSEAIKQLKEIEESSARSREALAETQTEILIALRDLERSLA